MDTPTNEQKGPQDALDAILARVRTVEPSIASEFEAARAQVGAVSKMFEAALVLAPVEAVKAALIVAANLPAIAKRFGLARERLALAADAMASPVVVVSKALTDEQLRILKDVASKGGQPC